MSGRDRWPSVRMRRVCMELRRLRTGEGLTYQDVAQRLGVHPSTVSRMENGERGLGRDDLTALLVIYRAARPLRNALLKLHDQARQPGLLDRGDLRLSDDMFTWIGFEEDAVAISNYEPLLIPGLLQTFPYARAVIESGDPALGEQEITDRTTARINRQKLLRGRAPIRLTALVHEAALRQDVGGPEVMRGQLVYLAEAARQEHIEIRVVPMAAGAHPGLGSGPFVIMDYAELPSLVLLENKTADLYLEEQADLATYKVVLRDISAVALCPERSVRLITEIAGSLS